MGVQCMEVDLLYENSTHNSLVCHVSLCIVRYARAGRDEVTQSQPTKGLNKHVGQKIFVCHYSLIWLTVGPLFCLSSISFVCPQREMKDGGQEGVGGGGHLYQKVLGERVRG